MSDHCGFFCEQCLAPGPLVFPTQCGECSSQPSDYLNELYDELHNDETGIYEVAKGHKDGETLVITTLFFQGMLPNDFDNYRNRGILVMLNTSQIHDKTEFHEALDFNLSVWKKPLLEGLTRTFCQPLAVLVRSGAITVIIAKVILLLIGNCLRDKSEVLSLLESVVYSRMNLMK